MRSACYELLEGFVRKRVLGLLSLGLWGRTPNSSTAEACAEMFGSTGVNN